MTTIEELGGIEIPDDDALAPQVTDVIVCASSYDDVPVDEIRAHPPVGMEPRSLFEAAVPEVDLGDGIKLASYAHGEEIFQACGGGQNFKPARQFGQLYSFVRERGYTDVDDTLFGYDEDGRLHQALALSRLIRDNGFSLQYAARVIEQPGRERMIRPAGATDGSAAYRVLPGREWLDGPEAEALAGLLAKYHDVTLPPRVREALWRAEYATRMARIDMMTFAIVSGLEALVKVGFSRSTSQFKRRVPALAKAVEVEGIDAALCGRMYDARSGWAHGSMVLFDLGDSPTEEDKRRVLEEVAAVRDLLRAAVRKAIEDGDFRAVFLEDSAIRARFSR